MFHRFGLLLLASLTACPALRGQEHGLLRAAPGEVGLNAAVLDGIDEVVNAAIARKQLPGAVVAITRHGKMAFLRAYGKRSLFPQEEDMTTDTIFDLASLTKPVATATAILLLRERGQLRLDDPVAQHLPTFSRLGKDRITIEHLLLHVSGLIADNPLADYDAGQENAFVRIDDLKPRAAPGERFTYSDVGFIVLGRLVEKLSGESLDAFTQREVFAPLGMADTGFRVPAPKTVRVAPTEKIGETWLCGVVHDPRARALGGVAGHAGLFGTAGDLSTFCQMLLNRGAWNGRQLLRAETVADATRPRPVPGGQRALGWDVQTSYSSNRGASFPVGGFGHTGFTGTSIWVDPASGMAVVFLSNRVHPDGKGNVNRLRGEVATLAGRAIANVK